MAPHGHGPDGGKPGHTHPDDHPNRDGEQGSDRQSEHSAHPGHDHSDHDHPEVGHGPGHPDRDHPIHDDDHPGHVVTAAGHEHERVFPPPLTPGDPGPEAVEKAGGRDHAVFLPESGRARRPHPAENPSPRGSFGYVDAFAELPADTGKGTLVFPIEPEKLHGVARETLRVFRWQESGEGWVLMRSSPGQTKDYVWAQVRDGGTYGLIGVHSDPLIARTLALMALMRGWTAVGGFGRSVAGKICRMLLCDPKARESLHDPEVYRALVEDNRRLGLPGVWLPSADGEPPFVPQEPAIDACAVCLGLAEGASQPPETAMLRILTSTPPSHGQWDVVSPVPSPSNNALAVHAALLRNGRILYFGGSENVGAQNATGGAAIDNTRLYDPSTGQIDVLPSPPRYDLFCCGHAFLADGRLLVAGGTKSWGGVPHPNHGTNFEGLRSAAVFDPAAPAGESPWSPVERLRPERGQTRGGGSWYPTLLTMPDGRVLKIGGPPEFEDSRHNNRTLEVFDPSTGHWLDQGPLADIPISNTWDLPQYPRLFVLPSGRVFCATPIEGPMGGPGWRSWSWNPSTHAWWPVGPAGPGGEYIGFDTSSVLLPLTRASNYQPRVLDTNRPDPKIADLGASVPTWLATSARALSDPVTGPPVRYHATTVLLPDATVLVIGGHNDPNSWDPPVLEAESFDPATGDWSVLASAAVPRVYHSVALLLPDGRVWTAGSDYGAGSHDPRMEIYSPPYLFRGSRPSISAAPGVVTIGTPFTVATPDASAIQTVALVRCGTSTHAWNGDQRWVDLEFAAAPGSLVVTPPPNGNVAPPGYYMLFLLDDDRVPSVAKILRVQASAQPAISTLYPRSGPSAGGSAVKILGVNFKPGATVSFGGVPAAATVTSESEIAATVPPLPAGALHDVVVTNPDFSAATQARGWLADFLDVPQAHMFHDAIERLFRSAVTMGCGGGNFCPDDPVTRAQMAAFLLRAEHGPGWTPPPATGTVFTDVSAGAFAAAAIEQAAAEGIFQPGGAFGPDTVVDRAEMAELLLKAEHGPGYTPPAATGIFPDVPPGNPSAPWIERLFKEGITTGCGGGNYCPSNTSTRGQMAVFLVKTFGL